MAGCWPTCRFPRYSNLVSERASDPSPTRYRLQYPRKDCRGRWGILNQTLWKRLTTSGTVKPTTHILDNEASSAFKVEIKKNCAIQLAPPDNHRRNLAKRAIQTFKSHFKSILAGVDDNFPMHLWDCWGLYNCLDGYSMYPRTFEYVRTCEYARKIVPSWSNSDLVWAVIFPAFYTA